MRSATDATVALRSRAQSFGPGIADVGISSLGNFVIALETARILTIADFGGVQAAIFVAVLAVGAARSFLGDAFVLAGRSKSTFGRHTPQELLGAAVLLAVPASAAVLLCAGLGLAPLGFVVPLAVCVPGMLLQDATRFAEHAQGRPLRAVVNSSSWTAVVLLVLGLRRALGWSFGPEEILWVWGISACLAGVVGCFMLGVAPHPSRGAAWLRHSVSEGVQLLGDYLLLQVTAVLPILLLGAVSGYEELGLLRVGQIPLGPLAIVVNSTAVFLQPHFTAIRREWGESAVTREARHVALVLSLALGVAAVALYLLPLSFVSHIVGQSWEEAHQLIPPLGLELCAGVIGAVYGIALRVHRRVRTQVIARIFITPITLTLTVILSARHGAPGAAWGLAVSSATLAGCWVFLNRHLEGPA